MYICHNKEIIVKCFSEINLFKTNVIVFLNFSTITSEMKKIIFILHESYNYLNDIFYRLKFYICISFLHDFSHFKVLHIQMNPRAVYMCIINYFMK